MAKPEAPQQPGVADRHPLVATAAMFKAGQKVLNSEAPQQSMGATGHRPRGATAAMLKAGQKTSDTMGQHPADATAAMLKFGQTAMNLEAPQRSFAAGQKANVAAGQHPPDATAATLKVGQQAMNPKGRQRSIGAAGQQHPHDATAAMLKAGQKAMNSEGRGWQWPNMRQHPADAASAMLKAGKKLANSQAVPSADANTMEMGAFEGFFRQDGLYTLASAAGRRSKYEHSSLVEDGRTDMAAQAQPDMTLQSEMLAQSLYKLADLMPDPPPVLDSLDAVVNSARVYMPLLTLFAWSAEHLLPSLPFSLASEGSDENSLGDDSALSSRSGDGTASTSASTATGSGSRGCAAGGECELLSLRALKDQSKKLQADISDLLRGAINECHGGAGNSEDVGDDSDADDRSGKRSERMS